MPTDQHATSPVDHERTAQYRSGHCTAGGHQRCRGDFRTAVCSCTCHTGPPPEPVVIATVRCFFGCPAVVQSTDPRNAHEAMEAHYYANHRGDIATALWAAS